MSWNTDPQLFIGCWQSDTYVVHRIVKTYNVPLVSGDAATVGNLDFSQHLSLGNNKESDYVALKSVLAKSSFNVNSQKVMNVNCQGLVVYWDYPKATGTWSRAKEIDSIINSLLPANINLSAKNSELVDEISLLKEKLKNEVAILADQKEAVDKKNSELVAENSLLKEKLSNEVTNLQEQLNQEKNAKQALEQQVLDLTAKLEESCDVGSGPADAQPWMRGDTAPNHWVSMDDLDVLSLPKNTPATIMERQSKPMLFEDVTTNVGVASFYRGTIIVAVNVEELSPENEKARFDPDIWGLYTNASVTYAARKPLESEMSAL